MSDSPTTLSKRLNVHHFILVRNPINNPLIFLGAPIRVAVIRPFSSSSSLCGACWMCSLMPGSAGSSVGDVQAAEQVACRSHVAQEARSGEEKGPLGGGSERCVCILVPTL